jgi:hypothetical protein
MLALLSAPPLADRAATRRLCVPPVPPGARAAGGDWARQQPHYGVQQSPAALADERHAPQLGARRRRAAKRSRRRARRPPTATVSTPWIAPCSNSRCCITSSNSNNHRFMRSGPGFSLATATSRSRPSMCDQHQSICSRGRVRATTMVRRINSRYSNSNNNNNNNNNNSRCRSRCNSISSRNQGPVNSNDDWSGPPPQQQQQQPQPQQQQQQQQVDRRFNPMLSRDSSFAAAAAPFSRAAAAVLT